MRALVYIFGFDILGAFYHSVAVNIHNDTFHLAYNCLRPYSQRSILDVVNANNFCSPLLEFTFKIRKPDQYRGSFFTLLTSIGNVRVTT